MEKILAGDKFLCIRTVIMDPSEEVAYKKGEIYYSDYDNRMMLGFVKFVMPIEIHTLEHKTSDFVGEVREKLVKKLTR